MHAPLRARVIGIIIGGALHAGCLSTFCQVAASQCDQTVIPGRGMRGVDDRVLATTLWDPDGAGPQPTLVVVGGEFRMGGGVAFWSPDDATYGWSLPTDWLRRTSSLGRVQGLCTYGGDLVVAGSFVGAGTTSLSNIALWNGTQWNELGGGINGPVHDIAIASNGDLIAVGEFNMAGGTTCRRIARWNGSTWNPVGYGMTGGAVTAVACMPNGDICVGGQFTAIGSVAANGLARWDGAAWSALPGGVGNAPVDTMVALPNGDLAVGGHTGVVSGVPSPLAVWNGINWSPLTALPMQHVGDVLVRANGEVVIGGQGQSSPNAIAFWDGTTTLFEDLGIGSTHQVHSLTELPNGSLFVGGWFGAIVNDPSLAPTLVNNAAVWDGAWWRAPSGGFCREVFAIDDAPNRDLICASWLGEVWRWTGHWWHKLPSPPPQPNPNSSHFDTRSAAVNPVSGNTFLGGPDGLYEWDGTSWTQRTDEDIQAMAFEVGGDLITAGSGPSGSVRRWDGAAWTTIGTTPPPNQMLAIALLGAGTMVCAGREGGNTTCNYWTGSVWQSMGVFDRRVNCLMRTRDGHVIAGGEFNTIDGIPYAHIALRDSSSWQPMGSGFPGNVDALIEMPNGDILAATSPTAEDPQPAQIWRWNGTAWSLFAETNTQELAIAGFSNNSTIRCMHLTRDGDLAVGGSFLTFDGAFSPHVAILEPTCPADATVVSGGCGTATLERGNLPWIGGTWTYRGVDMPPLTLAVAVTGFGLGSVPLSPALPQAQPGCDLLVSPDLLDVQFSNTSVVEGALAIPHDPALIGGLFYQQLLPFEVDASLAVVEVTATNALSLTIGAF